MAFQDDEKKSARVGEWREWRTHGANGNGMRFNFRQHLHGDKINLTTKTFATNRTWEMLRRIGEYPGRLWPDASAIDVPTVAWLEALTRAVRVVETTYRVDMGGTDIGEDPEVRAACDRLDADVAAWREAALRDFRECKERDVRIAAKRAADDAKQREQAAVASAERDRREAKAAERLEKARALRREKEAQVRAGDPALRFIPFTLHADEYIALFPGASVTELDREEERRWIHPVLLRAALTTAFTFRRPGYNSRGWRGTVVANPTTEDYDRAEAMARASVEAWKKNEWKALLDAANRLRESNRMTFSQSGTGAAKEARVWDWNHLNSKEDIDGRPTGMMRTVSESAGRRQLFRALMIQMRHVPVAFSKKGDIQPRLGEADGLDALADNDINAVARAIAAAQYILCRELSMDEYKYIKKHVADARGDGGLARHHRWLVALGEDLVRHPDEHEGFLSAAQRDEAIAAFHAEAPPGAAAAAAAAAAPVRPRSRSRSPAPRAAAEERERDREPRHDAAEETESDDDDRAARPGFFRAGNGLS